MADEKEQPMVIHVNKETIEFLRLQLETEVRKRLLVGIGLPLGGGGIIAMILALFLWLPEKVRTLVNESKQVETTIQGAVVEHLKSEDGHELVRRAVAEAMSGVEVKKIVREATAPEIKKYLEENDRARTIVFEFFNQSPEGKQLVADMVKEQMESPAVRQQIRDAIDKGLQTAMGALKQDVSSRSALAILAVDRTAVMQDPKEVPKAGYRELEEFIYRERGKKSPLSLTLAIGGGVRYSASACVAYSERLRQEFGENYLGIFIKDQGAKPLAFLDAATYLGAAFARDHGAFNEANGAIIDALNSGDADAVRAAAERADPGSTTFITATRTLGGALRDAVWRTVAGRDDMVGVVDGEEHFLGVTRRSKLIDAVVMK
jgi:hypothetical protein